MNRRSIFLFFFCFVGSGLAAGFGEFGAAQTRLGPETARGQKVGETGEADAAHHCRAHPRASRTGDQAERRSDGAGRRRRRRRRDALEVKRANKKPTGDPITRLDSILSTYYEPNSGAGMVRFVRILVYGRLDLITHKENGKKQR